MAMKSNGFSSRSARHSELLRHAARVLTAASFILAAAACDSVLDDDDDSMHIRVVNLVEDSPTLEFRFGETVVASAGYAAASAFIASPTGSQQVQLATVAPPRINVTEVGHETDDDNDKSALIGTAVSRSFEANVDYLMFAVGKVEAPQFMFVEKGQWRDTVANDKIVVQLINAMPDSQPLDVYVTAPEAGVTTPQHIGTLTYSQATTPQEFTLKKQTDQADSVTLYADLTVEVRPVGSTTPLHKTKANRINEQSRATFVIMKNAQPGPSPVDLLLLGDTPVRLADPNNTAELRFTHVSRDTPALDLFPGSNLQTPLAQNIAFRGASPYVSVGAGEVNLIATPTSTPGTFVFIEEFAASLGGSYSAYAVGPLAKVDATVLADDRRSVATQSRYRFFHTAQSLDNDDVLDIYLTEHNKPLTFDTDGDDKNESPLPEAADLPYGGASGYTSVLPGSYDIYVTYGDDSKILLGPVPLDLAKGSNQTLVLTNAEDGSLTFIPFEDAKR